MAGYTWFNVSEAVASDGNKVEVYNAGGVRLWPYQIRQGKFLIQPLFAVRARTHEEIASRKEVQVAVASLVVLIAFQIVDWMLRIFGNI